MVAILDDDIMDALDLLQRQLADKRLLRREFEEDITQNNPEAGCWFTCSGWCKGRCSIGGCTSECSSCHSDCGGHCSIDWG